MSTITMTCPGCGIKHEKPFKKRNGAGFCTRRCAYASRVIHKTRVMTCKTCGKNFLRNHETKFCSNACKADGYRGFKHSEETRAKLRGPRPVKAPRGRKTCVVCGSEFVVKLTGRTGLQKLCSERCRRTLMSTRNPMTLPACRAATVEYARNRPPEVRRKIAEGTRRAWADGQFDGVRVGKCDWYHYEDRRGNIHKVQGTWELALAHWMVETGVEFKAHVGRIPYVDSRGITRTWLPDFYVPSRDEWLDVKSDHFYDQSKFEAIRASNPNLRVWVITKVDLDNLGVPIYGPGNKRLPYLDDLVRRFRVQSGAGRRRI